MHRRDSSLSAASALYLALYGAWMVLPAPLDSTYAAYGREQGAICHPPFELHGHAVDGACARRPATPAKAAARYTPAAELGHVHVQPPREHRS